MSQTKNPAEQGKPDFSPAAQADESHGSIKRPQRGEDDFRGKSDTPRGSEPEIRGTSGCRG
jgi:hypothetical protein